MQRIGIVGGTFVHFFEEAVENSPLALIHTDGDAHTIRYANAAFSRLCGTRTENLIGQPLAEAVSACRADGSIRLLDEVYRGKGLKLVNNLMHHEPERGSVYWSYLIWPALDSESRAMGLMVQVIDTTTERINALRLERVSGDMRDVNAALVDSGVRQQELAEEAERSEAALRESEERFRFMAESMPQKIFTAKPSGEVDYFNQEWTEFTGLSFDQIRDWGWTQFIHPDDVEENVRAWQHSICTGEPFQFEHRFRRADGAYRWHLSRARAMRDAEGSVLMWIGSNTEIDDQKRAEEARASLAAIVSSSDDAIIGKDLNGIITSWNRGAERLFGYTAQESIGRPVTMLIPSGQMDEESRILKRIRHGESVEPYETVRCRRDGSLVNISLTVSPVIDARGQIAGASKIARDISERKRAEEEREKHLAEIETLNHRLQRAMAETHHRVKNNLQVISALVDIQTMQHEDTVPAGELVRIGQHIRALAAIHDLLTSNAKTSVDAECLHTGEVMDKLMPLLQLLAQGRRLSVRAENIEVPLRYGTSLAMLVNELVSNAVKHGGNVIDVSLGVVLDKARLEVCDDGPGFPKGFDPRKAANTGLELIESLSRVDLRGSVTYQNHAEGGARVVVEFPVPKATAAAQ